jgi:hypothetical protein
MFKYCNLTHLSADGIEWSLVPWKRIIWGNKETADLADDSLIITCGENFCSDSSPSIILENMIERVIITLTGSQLYKKTPMNSNTNLRKMDR